MLFYHPLYHLTFPIISIKQCQMFADFRVQTLVQFHLNELVLSIKLSDPKSSKIDAFEQKYVMSQSYISLPSLLPRDMTVPQVCHVSGTLLSNPFLSDCIHFRIRIFSFFENFEPHS